MRARRRDRAAARSNRLDRSEFDVRHFGGRSGNVRRGRIVFMLLGLAAGMIPARRAANVDPLIALRAGDPDDPGSRIPDHVLISMERRSSPRSRIFTTTAPGIARTSRSAHSTAVTPCAARS